MISDSSELRKSIDKKREMISNVKTYFLKVHCFLKSQLKNYIHDYVRVVEKFFEKRGEKKTVKN